MSTLAVLVAFAILADAQVTIPYTFSPNTDILSSEVNSNFSTLGSKSLNREGGTVTGDLASSGGSLSGSWAGTFSVTGAAQFDADALRIADSNASHFLIVTPGSDLTANRVLSIVTGDAARAVTLTGDPTLTAGTMAVTGTGLNQFAATTSAQLAGIISDETGSGSLVFSSALGGTVASQTSTTDANNTTTETTVLTTTVAGGTLSTANALHLTMVAQVENDTGASRTTTIRVKYGATTVFTGAVLFSSAFTERSPVLVDFWLYAQGATNAQTARMEVHLGLNSGSADGGDLVQGATLVGFSRNLAVDSTSNQTFAVTVQNSNNDYLFRTDSARLVKVQ